MEEKMGNVPQAKSARDHIQVMGIVGQMKSLHIADFCLLTEN